MSRRLWGIWDRSYMEWLQATGADVYPSIVGPNSELLFWTKREARHSRRMAQLKGRREYVVCPFATLTKEKP